jgi:phospholipid/cholesterol/gamma-HCH transport system ATP-binding protein
MIQIRGLYKRFGPNEVLKGLDLNILDNEIFTLLGGSGEGKSVFLKNVIGLMRPERGSIKIDGKEITGLQQKELSVVQTKFGMLFQGGALFDSLSVGDNVAFGLRRLTKHTEREIKEMVVKYLGMVGLEGVENKLTEDLSIGMRRRVALARAIATHPKYILYDEPTTGLDPITTDVICDLFMDLQKKLRGTSVIVTHDLKTAFKLSDRVGLLYDGQIVEVSDTENFKNSDNPYVRQFIKGSRIGPIENKTEDKL